MVEIIAQFGNWTWFILAGILLLAELAAPGIFFLWLGLAAAAVGLVGLIADFGWQVEAVLFALLSVAFVLLIRPRFKDRMEASDQPNLNQRMLNYVGKTYVLTAPIVNGRGHLTIEDTNWDIEGPDSAAGEKVRISGVSGMKFTVGRV